MDDPEPPKMFHTLSNTFAGEESDEEAYFNYSATLRIFGDGVPFEEIAQRLGVTPTNWHRKGEQRRPNSVPYQSDLWSYQSPLLETEPLANHIDALWQVVRPAVAYLKALKTHFTVDVFCGYRSNCDTAGFEVSHTCLELFTALEIPFGVSVIIA